ncbi:hypothetical protein KP509_32G048200 [Ceratopteris richardii]|uniref:S1 motif domain-containing protein n=1 Tax=Ceratopteris richardii TaxID=49495 RepID=A0A8T2QT36_CERRI|nr:hypothetical protein KP509_32G048200 [Ceratopteris richardii]
MGPAILLCPSSSATYLWGQTVPPIKLKQKEGGTIPFVQRWSATTGDLTGRPAFLLHSATTSDRCRKFFTWRRGISAAAAGSEVSVEEAVAAPDAEQSVASEPSASNEDSASDEVATAADKTQARRTLSRSNSNANKRVIVVSSTELVAGAVFPGKVVSIQSFGAFVDFGAFTNGLVHISRLSRNYVKKVEDVVQVGQDVKVQIVEVDFEANRISLMLVEEAKEGDQQKDIGKEGENQPRASLSQTRPPRRDSPKRSPSQKRATPVTTLKKGEIITGVVKNMIKSGVFLSLPDGTDGYLPTSEVIFKAQNTNLESQFQVGEEVTVRALRIERGRVTLTMRREVNFDKINEDLNKGVIEMATNPFELAFRRNELIANYLTERDKLKAQTDVMKEGTEDAVEAVKDVVEEKSRESSSEGEEAEAANEEEKDVVKEPIAESSAMQDQEGATAVSVEEAKDVVDDQKVGSSNVEEEVEVVASAVDQKGEALDVKGEATGFVEEQKDVVDDQKVESSDVQEEVATSVEEPTSVLEASVHDVEEEPHVEAGETEDGSAGEPAAKAVTEDVSQTETGNANEKLEVHAND